MGNVEFVCLLINFAKNNYSKEDVQKFISELKMVQEERFELSRHSNYGFNVPA